jgi:UDP-N-acetylmuramate--alanine ligase
MFNQYKHAHFVGIGGIGMSALAKWFLREGVKVSGSDLHPSQITDELVSRGVSFFVGHDPSNINKSVDLLVYSSAVPFENVERVTGRDLGINERTNFELLGEISKNYNTIVVSGTNGKSTTTAMLGLILEEADLDPNVLLGSFVPSFADGNLRVGKGKYFVVEGCEYRANMLNLFPSVVVLTNIEEDHLDYYRDLEHIQETFQKFLDTPGNKTAIYNVDDAGTRALRIRNGVGFGSGVGAKYRLLNRIVGDGAQCAEVTKNSVVIGKIDLKIPGEFNMMNALAATTCAMELGVSFEICATALSKFTGLWRRFERVGKFNDADIISDYGHHPSAVKLTINAAREFFPRRRIVLCYQPHQHDRTKKLFNEFVEALPMADVLLLSDIYEVAGRNETHDVSSLDLVKEIKRKKPMSEVVYCGDLALTESLLRLTIRNGDIAIVMGAGDIDLIARKL